MLPISGMVRHWRLWSVDPTLDLSCRQVRLTVALCECASAGSPPSLRGTSPRRRSWVYSIVSSEKNMWQVVAGTFLSHFPMGKSTGKRAPAWNTIVSWIRHDLPWTLFIHQEIVTWHRLLVKPCTNQEQNANTGKSECLATRVADKWNGRWRCLRIDLNAYPLRMVESYLKSR